MKTRIIVAFTLLATAAASWQDTYKNCTNSAATQSELTRCAGEDAKRADTELNRVYQQLSSKAKDNNSTTAKIRAAQRAWMAFRDAQLQAMFPRDDKQAAYGTMFPMCYANLATEMTRQRTAQLKRMVENWTDDGPGCQH